MDAQAPPVMTPAEMVAKYVELRDAKKIASERFDELVKERYTDRMEELGNALLEHLRKSGATSISSESGTAYQITDVSVTVADQREFKRHVIGSEAWDLIDWRANKTEVNRLVEEGEGLPPGVNRTTKLKIGIRRKSE